MIYIYIYIYMIYLYIYIHMIYIYILYICIYGYIWCMERRLQDAFHCMTECRRPGSIAVHGIDMSCCVSNRRLRRPWSTLRSAWAWRGHMEFEIPDIFRYFPWWSWCTQLSPKRSPGTVVPEQLSDIFRSVNPMDLLGFSSYWWNDTLWWTNIAIENGHL